MRDSVRYRDHAEAVLRLAAKAESATEKDVYLSIAEGWRRLATEADHREGRVSRERRSFTKRE